MRNRTVWLMGALLSGWILSGSGQAQQITNLIATRNPGFESGAQTPWGVNAGGVTTAAVVKDCVGAAVPEGPIEGTYCLYLKVSGPSSPNWWNTSFSLGGPPTFEKGKKYTLSLWVKSKSGTAQINFKPEHNGDPWTGYGETQITATEKWAEYHVTTPVFADNVSPTSLTFHIGFKAQEFWVDDCKFYEGDYVPTTPKNKLGAYSPTPDRNGVDVPRDPVLSWKAGPFAATHNVYLGTSFDDVNTADLSKAVSKGQTGTTFDPADLFEYGKTYYWRVDEVNAAPSTAVFKGDVWSFTVEPYAYPITSVTATASSQDKPTTGPANTVNGSGLTNDLHSTSPDAMWLSSITGPTPVWIRYQFDKVYKLQELWVWNHNSDFEPVLGYGFKDVTIETSIDGTTWTALKDVQFAQAPALAGYAHNTTVDMGGVMARYVRLTAKSNWSMVGLKQYGLSEVRFFYVPVEARAPQPVQYAENVGVGATLDWRPGRDVTSQKVYFGTDKAAVTNGTATNKSVTDHGFTPGALDFGTTYYWKVDEVGAATYPGSIWTFTTQPYAVVDDFESYTDKAGNEIFTAWIDGYTNGNGSVVGYFNASGGTFGERTIIHGGKQSMPFEYNNIKTPFYSEAERTFDAPQDWTGNGANTLSLWFKGNPAPFLETAPGQYKISADGADVWGNSDNFRFVYKSLTGDGSISAKVIGIADATAVWAKAGVMIRNSLDQNSTYAFMFPTPDGRRAFQNRPTTGGSALSAHSNTGAITFPFWVKLERKGNQLTASYSTDGKTWTVQPATENTGADKSPNPQTINMASTVYVGLAVASNNAAAAACTGQFSDVVTTGSVSGQWIVASLGPNPANDPAGMYVTVEDKAGKKKTVVHPDATATTFSAWTEWRIALSDLTGVNLAAVKKLTLGVGDRANPKAGGAGKLYFDDIAFGKPILPVGLVASYSLEGDVKDSSGHGHDGTVMGTVTAVDGPAGKGKALLFPGIPGNCVSLGTFNPSEKTGLLSVSLWAKWNGLSTQWQGLIGKRNAWAVDQTMWYIEAAQSTGILGFGQWSASIGSGNTVLKVGEWTHIAVTFDKTTARFYVNGVQTASGAFTLGVNREASVQFGQDSADGNAFNGALDEIKIYDIVLTPAEIQTLAAK